MLIVPYFIVVGVFQLIGMSLVDYDYEQIGAVKSTEQHLVISFFGSVGTFLLLWLFMKYVDKEKFVSLGFNIKNKFKDILLGVLLGLSIMGSAYLLLSFLNEIEYHKTVFSLKEIGYSIIIFLVVAITEEALFRGYILRNLMYTFNKYIALLFSSVLFVLAHAGNPNMDWFSALNLFLAGVLLGTSYIYNKNLWLPIALHFSWNFFQTLFGFNVSGQENYSLIEFKMFEKNILNGGDFGFEGSIFSIISQALLIVILFFYYEFKNWSK